MRNFCLAVCRTCFEKKEPQSVNFHLDHRPERLTFKCFTCGVQEVFYFLMVPEKEEEKNKAIKKSLRIAEN